MNLVAQVDELLHGADRDFGGARLTQPCTQLLEPESEVEDLVEAMDIEVLEGEFHTVGGLVFRELGRVPVRGEAFDYGGLRFEILDADDRRVNRVRVSPAETVENA